MLAVTTFVAGQFLGRHHSPLTDFTRIICFPFITIVFLLSLFLMRIHRISSKPATRNIFRMIRIAVFVGILCLLIAILWPRSYGSRPMQKRASTRYWDLPTGSRIAYTLIPGKGIKKPFPIIYLQGGPGGSIDDGLIQMLTPISEDGYDIYLYDQIGSGWSDRLANIREYTADRHKRDLEAIVEKIGAAKVIIVGQSWGAILAVLFAADDPQRIASMILTGPGPIQPEHPDLAGVAAPDSFHLREPYYSNRQGNEQADNIRVRSMTMMAMEFGVKLASDKEADDFEGYLNRLVNRSTVYDTSRIREMRPELGGGFYAQIMTARTFRSLRDPRPKLRNSRIPVLVMKGQYDNQKWGFTHEYLDLFSHHRLAVIPNAGHCIFCDQPEDYLSTIRDYLGKGE
jgi:proline iminopeptidase